MDLFNNQQARGAAIKAMHEYHLAYKTGKNIDTAKVKQSLKKLSQSDRLYVYHRKYKQSVRCNSIDQL